MLPQDLSGRTTSYLEFWLIWLMYIPVVLQLLLRSVWHRSLILPLIANPAVPLSGMVGVQKSAVFDAAGAFDRDWILPWRIYSKTNAPIPEQAADVAALIDAAGFKFPVVGKPDIGCRGAGVKLIGNRTELEAYLSEFPVEGEPYRRLFSASHSRGAVFRDAAALISEEVLAALDQIFADIPSFHYGRLDIKFKDIGILRSGRDFHIIEINGASSESINIWYRNASLGQALRTLLQQYHTLFKLGSANRTLGLEPLGLKTLFSA